MECTAWRKVMVECVYCSDAAVCRMSENVAHHVPWFLTPWQHQQQWRQRNTHQRCWTYFWSNLGSTVWILTFLNRLVGGGTEFTSLWVHHRDSKHAECLEKTFWTKIFTFSVLELVVKTVGLAPTVSDLLQNTWLVGGGLLFSQEWQQMCLLWAD